MVLSWITGDDDVGRLIAKRKYRRATQVLRKHLADRPSDLQLQQRLADVLMLDGELDEALDILEGVVQHFADEGFYGKAIAVFKKMRRIAPDRELSESQISDLLKQHDQEVASRGFVSPVQQKALPALRESQLFDGCSPQQLLAMVSAFELRSFKPGEIVITENESTASLYLVAEGEVRVYVRHHSGVNRQLGTLQRGDFFGEISLITDSPRTATITTASACDLLELSPESVKKLAESHPEIDRKIREICSQRSLSPEEVSARGGIEHLV